jgi:mono/diheme cytochrome c family protein
MATKNFAIAVMIVGLALGTAAWGAEPAGEQTPTFYKDVLPLAQKHCQVCHRPGQIGPFSLLDYQSARPWAKAIKNAVTTRRMPPWLASPKYGHFNNDRSLSQAEMDTIVAWVDGGAPAGDPKDAPPAVPWPEGGWTVQPDMAVDLPPYPVPATGVIEWESILIPAPFKEDTWVTSVQVLPGAPAVVHHMCFDFQKHNPALPYNVYEWMEVPRDDDGVALAHDGSTAPSVRGREGTVARRPVGSTEVSRFQGRQTIRSATTQFCYLPGLTLEDYRPIKAGVLVPAGSDLVVGLHYTTIGVAAIDRTRIGFTVAKTPPAKKVITLGDEDDPASSRIQDNSKLAIPPYEANYLGPPANITFKKDTELVWFRPHAHVRGKSARYTLIHPDGREEIVLDVPRFDFNWQLTYRTSLMIPKGARMHVQYAYDNSAANRYNPDPSKWVYFGGQSWEEMGSAMMGFLVDRDTKREDIIVE